MKKTHYEKKLFIFFLLIASIFGWQNTAFGQEKEPPKKSFAEIVNMPVIYQLPGMDEVTVKKDIVYRKDGDTELKMDVYLPPGLGKQERRGAAFFIHGGTAIEYRPKDWGVYRSWGKLAAASGMIGVVFTHRMGIPAPNFELAESDLKAAINHVRENAADFNVDKNRIALVAYSAGGPLLSVPMRDKPSYIRALASVYGYLDIRESGMHRQQIKDAEVLKKYSPLVYLATNTERIPPIFIARAGLDEFPGLIDATDRFVAVALAKNLQVEIMNHPRGVHGFDNQTDDERSREIIRRLLGFLSENLLIPADKLNKP